MDDKYQQSNQDALEQDAKRRQHYVLRDQQHNLSGIENDLRMIGTYKAKKRELETDEPEVKAPKSYDELTEEDLLAELDSLDDELDDLDDLDYLDELDEDGLIKTYMETAGKKELSSLDKYDTQTLLDGLDDLDDELDDLDGVDEQTQDKHRADQTFTHRANMDAMKADLKKIEDGKKKRQRKDLDFPGGF